MLTLMTGLCMAATVTAFAESGPNYTTLVYPGTDGRLVYAADSLGNIIPDFSNAGYSGGGVKLPTIPNKVTLWGVEGDATPVIQAAIDSVSAMPVDANGFRGAVLLRAGYYELDGTVTIKTSGVVLRGAGQDELGTILYARGTRRLNTVVQISGATRPAIDSTAVSKITDKYVPVGARTFTVENAKVFKVADKIYLRRYSNQEWLHAIGMDAEGAGRNAWRSPFTISSDRIITAINGNKVTIDAPIMCAIETVWGGGDIIRYSDAGRVQKCGVENIRGISNFNQDVRQREYGNLDRHPYVAEPYYSDENHAWTFITIDNATNCWVRDITALHFGNSLAAVTRNGSRVTIQDCTNLDPIAQRWGARRFIYLIEGQLNLVQRCTSDQGRHSYVLGGPQAAGPNVFLECVATRSYATSEPHSQWSTGILYDQVHGPLTARYWDYGSGWAGANVVFWNCEGDFRIQSPATAKNYTFGHIGINASAINYELQDQTKPEGYMESLDRHVTPTSLYLTQLAERLGPQALANIAK
jgi:hypothetical protein